MNPIPLSGPDGTVYTYACGTCKRVCASSESMARRRNKKLIAELAQEHKRDAEGCCQCQRCKGPVGLKGDTFTCGKCLPAEEAERAERRAKYAADRADAEAAREAALTKSTDRVSALALCNLMSEISEEYYSAGWLSGLERDLWPMVQGGPRHFGFGELTDDEVSQLKALHWGCGGWWYYKENVGQMFATTDEWLRMYNARSGT